MQGNYNNNQNFTNYNKNSGIRMKQPIKIEKEE
jgi:hypothetical protein